jgi:hypothetical protein
MSHRLGRLLVISQHVNSAIGEGQCKAGTTNVSRGWTFRVPALLGLQVTPSLNRSTPERNRRFIVQRRTAVAKSLRRWTSDETIRQSTEAFPAARHIRWGNLDRRPQRLCRRRNSRRLSVRPKRESQFTPGQNKSDAVSSLSHTCEVVEYLSRSAAAALGCSQYANSRSRRPLRIGQCDWANDRSGPTVRAKRSRRDRGD